MPSDPNRAYSSMGNYIFNPQALAEIVSDDALRTTEHDFGRSVIGEVLDATSSMPITSEQRSTR